MIRETVSDLKVPSFEERTAIAGLERTIGAHDTCMASIPAMNSIEVGGEPPEGPPLAFPIRVAAWNLERCLFPDDSADHIRSAGADIVLLSEMDHGMARTGQRNTTADVAGALGMAYAYGVEFVELGLGSDTEREFCTDDVNARGFHGNGLMARAALDAPFMLRLAGERLWFTRDGDQPRLGERMAIGATVATETGPIAVVSTHLESATTAHCRERQVVGLLDVLDAAFPGLPVLIGGDLNTGNHAGGDFEAEGLFARAAERGYARHGGPIDAMTTRPSLITRWPDRAMKLDWFLSRGLSIGESRIVSSLDAAGRPLSDHDMIVCRIEGRI
ncbi:endonuclease [Rhizobium sp. TRM95111]|uniref:endonuclease/exonuclease/phosphatase family protein n=1 Tax=Rhizobium alarense TaxID=2846851 RepID=UPI001F29A01C|nr:endonuclease/exonuclease/phosphatase family protein [Rhizobium alarense]MCF3640807.1 endonuclease [Rhizobium alarense]